jgi:hypothetical protein
MSPNPQVGLRNPISSQTIQCSELIPHQSREVDFIPFNSIFDAYDDRARELGRYYVKLDRLSTLCDNAPSHIGPEWFLGEITRQWDIISSQNRQLQLEILVPCSIPFLGSYEQLGEKLAEFKVYYKRMEAWKDKNIRKSIDGGSNVTKQLNLAVERYNEVCSENDILWEQFFRNSWRAGL